MYFRDLLKSLKRFWYVAVLGLVATGVLCWWVAGNAKPTYGSEGSVLLLPPKSSVGEKGNPYLYLGGLSQAVDVLVARMGSDQIQKTLDTAHPGITMAVIKDMTTTGPLIKVSASGADADASLSATQALLQTVTQELASLQEDLAVPEPSRITSMNLVSSAEATPDFSLRDRLVLTAGAAGTVVSLLLAGLLDGLVRHRGRRARRPTTKDDEHLGDTDPEHEERDDGQNDGQNDGQAAATLSKIRPARRAS